MRHFSFLDGCVQQVNHALNTVFTTPVAGRVSPAAGCDAVLNDDELRHAAGLMRVNHVGEVCAQALYQGQAWVSGHPAHQALLLDAAAEEVDHLAWTAQRLDELGSHTSVLNPLWYAGAFALGVAAARVSEAVSLGFVVETERQVGAHLSSHLDGEQPLPLTDAPSRAIVAQMRDEELAHAEHAQAAGAMELPNAVKQAMAGMAKVMTTLAYRF